MFAIKSIDRKEKKQTLDEARPSSLSAQQEESLVHEGQKLAVKSIVKDEEKQKEKFEDLLNHGSRVLYKIKTVWPFDPFPNTITIDTEKVTVAFREFFWSAEIRSIHIKNIAQVYADAGPLFATLYIADQIIVDETSRIRMPYLRKGEAMRARRIIQGLLTSHKEGIDVTHIEDRDLVTKLEAIGRMG